MRPSSALKTSGFKAGRQEEAIPSTRDLLNKQFQKMPTSSISGAPPGNNSDLTTAANTNQSRHQFLVNSSTNVSAAANAKTKDLNRRGYI